MKLLKPVLQQILKINFTTSPLKFGAIRDAGGAFAARGRALENQYFNERNEEALKKLKKMLNKQMHFHKRQQEGIQEKIAELKNELDIIDKEELVLKKQIHDTNADLNTKKKKKDRSESIIKTTHRTRKQEKSRI